MDPPRARPRPIYTRIPRTRGDGPAPVRVVVEADLDSPHPRGWTQARAAERRRQHGFPAPAGMDPPRQPGSAPRSGIPRTRGDGPALCALIACSARDSPHPRGWTLSIQALDGALPGFPAPAGMDPHRRPRRTPRPRIPRTRGDGPRVDGVLVGVGLDSPHPRGWTRRPRRRDLHLEGFPAPAGMDPELLPFDAVGGRIPRTRGDGPSSPLSPIRIDVDSPHPRGWTLGQHRRHLRVRGFPAPAGMDPEGRG